MRRTKSKSGSNDALAKRDTQKQEKIKAKKGKDKKSTIYRPIFFIVYQTGECKSTSSLKFKNTIIHVASLHHEKVSVPQCKLKSTISLTIPNKLKKNIDFLRLQEQRTTYITAIENSPAKSNCCPCLIFLSLNKNQKLNLRSFFCPASE